MTSRIIPVVLVASMALMGSIQAAEVSGKDLFQSKCALCHGADGTAKEMWAKKGMHNFNDAAWQKERTDDQLKKAITDGIPDKKMPTYKDKLSADEIQALVKHIRSLAPAK